MPVRTRIAPSPTGFPHLATVYQALFDYAYAKKNNGKFVLRIEDTDRVRYVEGAEEVILNTLEWFGLKADESPVAGGEYGPYRQSERLDLYKKYALELVKKGKAYYCFCTKERLEEMRKGQEAKHLPPMYDKHCLNLSEEIVKKKLSEKEPYVIRMKVPEHEEIKYNDVILGEITFDSSIIDHQVLFKSDGFPTYHLAVVVDDYLMKITHVIRGREWVSSMPKHILLYKYFEWEMPKHAHLPLILNADGKGKLSKRHGHASASYYRKMGYLPEAILNYLSNIVWNHPKEKEIYTIDEFIREFDLDQIKSTGPRFDLTKLDWINGIYIRQLDWESFFERLNDGVELPRKYSKIEVKMLFPLVRDRMKKLSDFAEMTDFYFWHEIKYVEKELVPKKHNKEETKKVLNDLKSELMHVKNWNIEEIEKMSRNFLDEHKEWMAGELFMAIRVGVTGKTITPPLFETIEVLGREKTLQRLEWASEFLK